MMLLLRRVSAGAPPDRLRRRTDDKSVFYAFRRPGLCVFRPTDHYPGDRPTDWLSVRPSLWSLVRPEKFLSIFWRTYGGHGLKFKMLMYPNHLQSWLDFGYSLVIFLILTQFWHAETGQI